MTAHYLSRTNLWIFGLPLAIFVLAASRLLVRCVCDADSFRHRVGCDVCSVCPRSDLGDDSGLCISETPVRSDGDWLLATRFARLVASRRLLGRHFTRHFAFGAVLPTLCTFEPNHLTNRWSQPLAVTMCTLDSMKQFLLFAMLAAASGDSARSR